jgi:hypothetical protein
MRSTTCLLFALLACGGTNDTAEQLPEFTEACAETTCTMAATVSSAAYLEEAIAEGAAWTPHGKNTDGCLPASGNIVVTGATTVNGADLARPATCTTYCGPEVAFRIRGTVPGVTCIDPEYFFDFMACGSIEVTDATIRVRTVLEDITPGVYSAQALVEVLPACEQPCADGELRCEATNTCWSSERDYCAYCLGGDTEVCACWNSDGFADDGTDCSYCASGHVTVGGTCNAGVCETD